jgi:hypothetical protein
MLLACQSLAVAHGASWSTSGDTGALPSCHEPGPVDGNGDRAREAHCPSENALFSPAGFHLPAMQAFSAIPQVDLVAPDGGAAPPSASRSARIEPPPPCILYCRLRN